MKNNTSSSIEPTIIPESYTIAEYFKRLAAKYRSLGVLTPQEGKLDPVAYQQSVARERFRAACNAEDLFRLGHSEARYTPIPVGR